MMYTTRIVMAFVLFACAGAAAAGPAARGDLDGNGQVDAADLAIMRAAFFTQDSRADLNGDGRVNFADLALLKGAGSTPRHLGVDAPPPAPAVYLLPESQEVTVGDPVAVDLYWDFTGDPALGGGTDFNWDPAALSLVSIVFDDNFGTGPGQFDPSFTRCDDEPCSGDGFIDGLATGNFDGLAGDGPVYIATITFLALAAGDYAIDIAEDNGVIAGPFVSAIRFDFYPDLSFAGATINVDDLPPAPGISAPTNVRFPDTVVGETSSAQVQVQSVGELPLTIAGVIPPGAPFTLSADDCTGQVLQPTQSCNLTVDFTPPHLGAAKDVLAISSDDPAQPELDVTLRGVGRAVPVPNIVPPGLIKFSQLRVHQTATHGATIRNNGTAPLHLGQLGAVDPLEAPFSITEDECSNTTLAPDTDCAFVVSYAPTEIAKSNDTFDILSDDPDEPTVTVTVKGNAAPTLTLNTTGIALQGGLCINPVMGQQVAATLSGSTRVPCEGMGLMANYGDVVRIQLGGTATSSTVVAGRGTGMIVSRVGCINLRTGQSVVFRTGSAKPWNCVAEGLVVSPGDDVTMAIDAVAR